jgi:hypothetical protein
MSLAKSDEFAEFGEIAKLTRSARVAAVLPVSLAKNGESELRAGLEGSATSS